MQIVVRVLGAEAALHNAPHVRLAVAIRILEVQELRALRNVDAAVAGFDPRGDE